jgi:c-di-GMP-binding flagellar brake protein YcgR
VFAVREATATRVQLGQAEDIGLGGMTIRHPKGVVLTPESPVLLSFELPDSREAIDAEGVVVSDRRIGSFRRTGVRFLVLRPEHQQAIAAFCRRAPKKTSALVPAPSSSQTPIPTSR